MNMNIIYILISFLCTCSLIHCIFHYFSCYSSGLSYGRIITISGYLSALAGFCLISLPANFALRSLLALFLCLFLSVFHKMTQLYRCISAALLWFILRSIILFLFRLSAKFDLYLFTGTGFHSAIGSILLLSLVWLCLLLAGAMGEYLTKKVLLLLEWIPRFCLPVSMTIICGLSLVFEINQNNYRLNFEHIETLSTVERPDLLFYLACAGLLLLNLLIPYLCQRMLDLKKEQKEKSLIWEQNRYFQNQFSLLQSSSREIRSLRHDMRNHLAAIRSMIDPEDRQASQYLDVLLGNFNVRQEISATGNILLDSLVNYKFRNYSAEKLKISYQAAVPEELPLNAWDMTVILGNLIDNAIEAAVKCPEDNRRISLSLNYRNSCLTIEISNTYTEKLQPSGSSYFTTKGDSGAHGLGLTNVRHTIEKNGGTFSFGPREDLFYARVVLSL